ncbi:MAG TPA: CBS domain-containing protein [Saprospiraceae bacterium]|nr:CBS domain-containing protein [Saprospiraceae bacterium]HMQ85539.1 CBS domain-containing protein [Saprospiraceae bacterium]
MNTEATIRSIMTHHPITVNASEKVSKVQEIFRDYDFHHLPVVQQGNKLIGIISKEDVAALTYLMSMNTSGVTFSKNEYQHLLASDIMTKSPLTLDPDDSVGLAADIFLANKFHAVPIVEDGELVGIVTTHDLLRYSFSAPLVVENEDTFEES